MDPISTADNLRTPNLFLHSLLVPGIWLALGIVAELVAPGFRLGITGSAGVFILMSVGISWLILKRYGRMPTNSESWRLVIYCSVLAILVEAWVLFVAMASPEVFPDVTFTPDAALFAILFAAGIDTLFFTLGFKVAAPRFLKNLIPPRAAPDQDAG